MTKLLATIFLTAVTVVTIVAQNKPSKSSSTTTQSVHLKIPPQSVFSYKIIPSVNKTWGYDIYINNKLTIHQPSIPGLVGNEGFKTKENAEKVADLVVSKFKMSELPTVREEDLRKLGVL